MDGTALSKIETGRRGVKVDELVCIAEAIGIAASELLQVDGATIASPAAEESRGPLRGRSARQRLLWLNELHEQLLEAGIGAAPRRVGTAEQIPSSARAVERLAEWARTRLGAVRPGVHLETLIDAIETGLGIDVMVDPQPGPSLGGALTGRSFALIYINSGQATNESRFTLAHELGHALAESGVSLVDDARFDEPVPKERAADAFARSFLLPADEVARVLDDHGHTSDALATMMQQFGVGWDLLLDRMHALGYIGRNDHLWLAKFDRRALAENLGDAQIRAALLSTSYLPCGLHHAPRGITARAWIGARRGVVPMDAYAALIGARPSQVVVPRQAPGGAEIFPRRRSRGSAS